MADATQTLSLTTSSYDDAWRYVQELERKGYSVIFTKALEGSNWWWSVIASKPRNS